MRLVVQRVKEARVKVKDEIIGEIGRGLLVFLGVGKEDTEADVEYFGGKGPESSDFLRCPGEI